jgi:hypothetical protein
MPISRFSSAERPEAFSQARMAKAKIAAESSANTMPSRQSKI